MQTYTEFSAENEGRSLAYCSAGTINGKECLHVFLFASMEPDAPVTSRTTVINDQCATLPAKKPATEIRRYECGCIDTHTHGAWNPTNVSHCHAHALTDDDLTHSGMNPAADEGMDYMVIE